VGDRVFLFRKLQLHLSATRIVLTFIELRARNGVEPKRPSFGYAASSDTAWHAAVA
jgi:hypothetical protein